MLGKPVFFSALLASFLTLPAVLTDSAMASPSSADLIKTIPFMTGQGAIAVPIDWADPKAGSLQIQYRILGASNTDRPFLFFVGGGPGWSSIDNYFVDEAERTGVHGYAKHFRVVLFDQRGTGLSAPLADKSPSLTPEIAIRFFSATSHAKDVGALIKKFTGDGDTFFLMGHSYGGLVINQYLVDRTAGPLPDGIVFANAGRPPVDPVAFVRERSIVQMRQAEKLFSPELRSSIAAAKEKLNSLQHVTRDGRKLSGVHLNILYRDVADARSVAGLSQVIDRILSEQATGAGIEQLLSWRIRELLENRLNCFVSACDMTGGKSDRTVINQVFKELKSDIEPWMLTEVEVFHAVLNKTDQVKLHRKIDRVAAPYALRPENKAVRNALAKVPLLVLAGDADPLISIATAKNDYKAMASARHHHFEIIEGGDHGSALTAPVADYVAEALRLQRNIAHASVCASVFK